MTNSIILGDIHLGKSVSIGKSNIGSLLNSRINDQIILLDWVLDYADDNNIKYIIITGDIFEEPKPHSALITLFISWLKKCQAYNVHVHIIRGNHDILRSGFIYSSPLDIVNEIELDNVSIYQDIDTIFIENSAITMLPFKDRKSYALASNAEALSILKESIIYELASIPMTYRKFLIGHLAIEGSIPVGDEIDDLTNELFCPLDMFNGYDYVWMGHVHKPQVMQKSNPYIAHIGSMDISNFSESEHNKHMAIINLNSADFHLVKLPTRPLKKITVTVPKDTANSTDFVINEINSLNDNYTKAIVKVEVTLASSDLKSIVKSEIENHLLKLGAFNVTSISESKKIDLIKKDENNILDNQLEINAAIKMYATSYVLDDNVRSKFLNLALEIYNEFKMEDKA